MRSEAQEILERVYHWARHHHMGGVGLPVVELPPSCIYRIADGKIAETWQMSDWAGFLRQVGA